MPVPSWPPTTLRRADLLFRLPRELRDKIYADALDVHCSIGLTEDLLPHIPPILQDDANMLPEALEVLVRMKIFSWNWINPRVTPLDATSICVNPYDIRHLEVVCCEHSSTFVQADLKRLDEYEKTYRRTHSRMEWEQLLEFPRLQDLAIYMQKEQDSSLDTFDFGPILYELRARNPGINITFFLSFDTILGQYWDDPMWNNGDDATDVLSYKSMGYVDMSDLIEPPTQGDLEYVHKHLPEYMNTGGAPDHRKIGIGLLDETPASRRALAKHYAVKEPALLRCQMRDQFEIYRKLQKGNEREESK